MAADIKLSKTLSRVLRHKAAALGFNVFPGGYVQVSDLLSHRSFKNNTFEDIQRVVTSNDKKRFSLKQDPETGDWLIAANQGHSFEVQNPELKEITRSDEFPVIVHGTYLKNWSDIQSQGLSRMGRIHIHFAQGEPTDTAVISGMRKSCEVLIYINLQKALNDGIKFYLSKNGVILCPGDDAGFLHPRYFSEVFQRHPRCRLAIGQEDKVS